MPAGTRFACTYVKRWVAVKWRWRLSVNRAERTFLAAKLRSCGWPRVAKPARAHITTDSAGSTTASGTTAGGTSTGSPATIGYAVHPRGVLSRALGLRAHVGRHPHALHDHRHRQPVPVALRLTQPA